MRKYEEEHYKYENGEEIQYTIEEENVPEHYVKVEMEKEIFRNNIPVDKLPALWNQKMKFLSMTQMIFQLTMFNLKKMSHQSKLKIQN